MRSVIRPGFLVTTLLVVLVAGVAAGALAGGAVSRLLMNGSPTTARVRVIDGVAWVPVADVARALDMSVVKKGGDYDLVKAGGAHQIANANPGRLDQEIFTGQWRFTALSVERMPTYTTQYRERPFTVEAGSGSDLVVIRCSVKNGTRKKDELVFETWEGNNTALATPDGQSFAPVAYDVRPKESSPLGAEFLPGAAIPFTLVFKVPASTECKDLVFTAIRYDFRAGFDQKKVRPTDIRVHLEP